MKKGFICVLLLLVVCCKKSTTTPTDTNPIFRVTAANNTAFSYSISEYQPGDPNGAVLVNSGTNVTSLDYSFAPPINEVIDVTFPSNSSIITSTINLGSNVIATYRGVPLTLNSGSQNTTSVTFIYNLAGH